MKLGKKTRKELVLDYLTAHKREWVPGLDLMNQYVGGLRAGARIFELRKEGYEIERRTSKTSDVDDYRLVSVPGEMLLRHSHLFATAVVTEPPTPQTAIKPVQQKVWDD